MNEADVHGLTAGYAVDALEREEAEAAERHLAECEDCRRDLADFRETAVRLAGAEAQEPRPGVWEAIRADALRTRQLPPAAERSAGARVVSLRGRSRWLPWALVTACALVAVVLAGSLVSVSQRLDSQTRHAAELEALLAASDTNMLEAPLGEARATVFASYERDAAVLVVEGLASAPPGMTYRMWWADEGGVRPAGTLEPSEEGRHAGMADDMGHPDELRVSLEEETGSAEPTGEQMVIDM
ncbi:anti-sigma factor [Nocardiopsis alborubida]|uniref:Regulator of SigK n=1 Tax=Nocardiopsis alborubida TaxID=146802 RepID=A0A7X6M977_9ACTN|nr:anti-sigma factor [Nocardiopsis alborubida]NKY97068.1 anti-sigma factor [Nocardiopsis alborubida]